MKKNHIVKFNNNSVKCRLSVVMAVYNGGVYLYDAVASVVNQSFRDFEFIIIDDGSTDNSLEVLKAFERDDKRIKIISRANRGQTKSLNEGLRYCAGEYIARMDADDLCMSHRFERQMSFLDANTDVAMCGTWADCVDHQTRFLRRQRVPISNYSIRLNWMFRNPFMHPSVMLRREVLDVVGGYNENIKYAEDYELWSRILYRFRTQNIPEVLIQYRIHSDQMTNRLNWPIRFQCFKIRCGLLLNLFKISKT